MSGSSLSLQQIGKWTQLVLSHLKRKRAQQIVLLTMIVHGIYFIASFEQMADTAGMSKATAQKAVEELEKAKLVEVILTGTGRGHPNVYQLRLPELVEHPHHTMTVP
jgi:MinD-like ATPase involved in chromosome partitioning or flagellar assembly